MMRIKIHSGNALCLERKQVCTKQADTEKNKSVPTTNDD